MVELKRPGRTADIVVARTRAAATTTPCSSAFSARALEEARALRPAIRTMQHVGFGVSIRRARAARGRPASRTSA